MGIRYHIVTYFAEYPCWTIKAYLYVVQRLFYSHAFNSIYDPTSTFYFVFSKVTVLGAWCV